MEPNSSTKSKCRDPSRFRRVATSRPRFWRKISRSLNERRCCSSKLAARSLLNCSCVSWFNGLILEMRQGYTQTETNLNRAVCINPPGVLALFCSYIFRNSSFVWASRNWCSLVLNIPNNVTQTACIWLLPYTTRVLCLMQLFTSISVCISIRTKFCSITCLQTDDMLILKIKSSFLWNKLTPKIMHSNPTNLYWRKFIKFNNTQIHLFIRSYYLSQANHLSKLRLIPMNATKERFISERTMGLISLSSVFQTWLLVFSSCSQYQFQTS